MHNPYDQLGKQMVSTALEPCGSVKTEAEVAPAARRIDLWFSPGPDREPVPEYLGLLGRILAGPSTVELFHDTPNGNELTACVIKHGEFRHLLSLRDPPSSLPVQWVISSGRPVSGIEGLQLRRMKGWPSGVYEGPRLLWTRLVVVSELPVMRSTLLLRLLGAEAVLRQAIAELNALGEDEPERVLALPILLRCRLGIPTDPTKQTREDQEFLMDTQDIVESFRQECRQEGRQEGRREALQDALLYLLRQRFGHEVDAHAERRIATASLEQVETWAKRILTAATLAELFAD